MDKDEKLIGIMCGSSRDYCTFSDVWCSNPLNEKQSYWSTDTYNGEPDCNSKGRYECDNTCNNYFQMFIHLSFIQT